MKDFRKQKKKLLGDDNRKMLPCLWSNTAESTDRKKGTEETCKRKEWERQSAKLSGR